MNCGECDGGGIHSEAGGIGYDLLDDAYRTLDVCKVHQVKGQDVARIALFQHGGGGVGNDVPLVHDHDAFSVLVCLFQIVRGDENGGAVMFAQIGDVFPQVGAALRVEAGGGLVKEDELWGMHETQRYVESPPLTTGEALDGGAHAGFESQRCDQVIRTCPGCGRGHPVKGTLTDQFVADALWQAAAAVLAHIADVCAYLVWLSPCVVTTHDCLTAGGRDQGGEHAYRRRFARAVRPEERHHLTLLYRKVQVCNRIGCSFGETLGQIMRFNDGF